MNGKKQFLLHFEDEQVNVEVGCSVLLTSGKELLQELKKEEVHCALIEAQGNS